MFTRLKRGQILKPKACNEGQIPYIVILQNRSFFLEFHKTARLSKDWENNSSPLEVKIKKFDFTNYLNKIVNEDLKFADEEEIIRLKKNIEELPEKTRNRIYGREKIEIFHEDSNTCLYGFEMQKIDSLNDKTDSNYKLFPRDSSENLYNKLYKKAVSVIQSFPLEFF
jgi:hypothetical protein